MQTGLTPFDPARLPELGRWFPDRRSCLVWGGPHVRFPFTPDSLREDTRVDALPSWMLLDAGRGLQAFGQYYLREGRCHLARLAVAPETRGRGVGTHLIRSLCALGTARLGVPDCSLFVLADNTAALALYRRLGFVEQPTPEAVRAVGDILYLVAAGAAAEALRPRD